MKVQLIIFASLLLLIDPSTAQSFEPFLILRNPIADNAQFGYSVASLEDLNGNGAQDYAVGVPGVDESGPGVVRLGSFWILMMQTESTVSNIHRFFIEESNFFEADSVGIELQVLRTASGEELVELIVSSLLDPSLGQGRPVQTREQWKVRLNQDGTVQNISSFPQEASFTSLGDINGDGFEDFLGVKQHEELFGNQLPTLEQSGQISLYFGDPDGVHFDRRLAFNGELSFNPRFGLRSAAVGDLNGDSLPEIALSGDDEIWIISLNSNLDIAWTKEISASSLGLDPGGRFGRNLASLDPGGDLAHLVVASPGRGDLPGSLHLLGFGPLGEVTDHETIPQSAFSVGSNIDLDHHFDVSVENLDPVSGTFELLIGTPYSDILGTDTGAVHKVRVQPNLDITPLFTLSNKTLDRQRFGSGFDQRAHLIGDMDGNGFPDLHSQETIYLLNENGEVVGTKRGFPEDVVHPIGDLNGDGFDDVITTPVWLVQDRFQGSAEIQFLNNGVRVGEFLELADVPGSPMFSLLGDQDRFGHSVTRIGDLNDDGVDDIAISAAGVGSGQVWVFLMARDGVPETISRIEFPDDGSGNYTAAGMYLAGLGDVNADGIPDLAVGLPHNGGISDSQAGEGAIHVLLLNRDATVQHRSIMSVETVNAEIFPNAAAVAWIAAAGDVDDDGTPDLLVGPGDEFSSSVRGFRVLFLNPDGSLRAYRLIDQDHGPLQDLFQSAISAGKYPQQLWDMDGDGLKEIIVDYLDEFSGARGPMVISLAPLLGAEILSPTVEPNAPKEGDDLQIRAIVRSLGRDAISGALINFRRAGQASFLTLDMENLGRDDWSAEIPGFLLSSQGIEYFLSASVIGRADHREPELGVFSVPVTTASDIERIVQSGVAEDGYRLVSVPLALTETDALTVLTSSLGEYSPSSWRFFDTDRDVSELNQAPLSIEPGLAYWLISRDQRILNWGVGTSVRTDSVFAIRLPTQWSAFGLPFNYDLDQSLLTTKSGGVPDIRRYTGGWEQQDEALVPFEGYAIFNDTGAIDTLYVAPSTEVAAISGLFGSGASKRNSEIDWSIPIHARMGRARDIDNLAVVGSALLNRADPPPIGNFVRLAFEGADYPLSTAAKKLDNGVARWTFNVSSERAGSVTVQFPDVSSVPPEYAVTLVDPATGIRQDLRAAALYTVASSGAGFERTLHLEVNAAGSTIEELPTELRLFPNFPNPFSASTTLKYALPEATSVELTIYDILGRRVTTLVHGEKPAGNHVLVWDGRTGHGNALAPGLYLARFTAGNFSESVTITRIN